MQNARKTPEQRAAISAGMRESWARRKAAAQAADRELIALRRKVSAADLLALENEHRVRADAINFDHGDDGCA